LTRKIFIFFSSFLYAERFTLSAILIFNQNSRGLRKKYSKSILFATFLTLFAPFFTFFNIFLSLFDRFLTSASFLIDVFHRFHLAYLAQTLQTELYDHRFYPRFYPQKPQFKTHTGLLFRSFSNSAKTS